jgi:DHA1 family multidrug resistance protein-like MFS transporter
VAVGERANARHETEGEGGAAAIAALPIAEPDSALGRRRVERALPFAIALPAATLIYWSMDSLSPALPALQGDLALSAAGAGLVYSLLFLGRLVANLPAAHLVDRIGTATTATAGAALLAIGSLGAMLANGGGLLFPSRAVQGIGISLLVTATLRSVLRAKPGRGAAMTHFGVASTIGSILGIGSGGYLTEAHGWRAVFAMSVVLAVVLAVAASGAWGAGSSGSGAGSATSTAPEPAPSSATADAMVPAILFNFFVFFNYSVWVALPLYTEHRFATSPETNANLLLVITLMHLVAAFPVGRAIRAWGSRPTLIGGLLVAIVGTLLVLPAPGVRWLIVPLALYGAGMVAAANAGSDLVLQRGGLGGRAVGMVRLSSDLALVLGPYATGTLADAFGYRAPFVALPIVTAAAVILVARERGTSDEALLVVRDVREAGSADGATG